MNSTVGAGWLAEGGDNRGPPVDSSWEGTGDTVGIKVSGRLNASEVGPSLCTDGGSGILIDVQDMDDVGPGGLVTLAALIEWSYRRRHDVVFKQPTDPDCASYLSCVGVGEVLRARRYRDPLPSVTSKLPSVTSNSCMTLSELKRFEGQDHLDGLVGRLMALYRGAGGTALEPLYEALYETAANVVDHSGVGGGWIALRFCPGTGEVVVATSDCGRGLSATLKTNTDKQAIVQAARLHETSTKKQGRGRGIPSVIELTKHYGGQVVFVTGTATAVFKRGNSTPQTTVQVASWPGTVVEVKIGRRKG